MPNELVGNLKKPNDPSLENIDVISIYKNNEFYVYKVKLRSSEYLIERTGLHYTQKVGTVLYHIFGVVSKESFFKIALNTSNLHWKLLEQTANS